MPDDLLLGIIHLHGKSLQQQNRLIKGPSLEGVRNIESFDPLQRMGGLQVFRDFVAGDVAMGRKASQLEIKVGLGSIVDSPVDAMSLRQLLEKFDRAALFSLSTNDIHEAILYGLLFGYLVVLPIGSRGGKPIITTGGLMALVRWNGSSLFWWRVEGKPGAFWEILLNDTVFLFAYAPTVVKRRLSWGGHEYIVGKDGRKKQLAEE